MSSKKKKSKGSGKKLPTVPDDWRSALIDAAPAVSRGVIRLAKKGGGAFWTAEDFSIRQTAAGNTKGFLIGTAALEDGTPEVVSKMLSPARAAKHLWGLSCSKVNEYGQDNDVIELRVELALMDVNGTEINDPETIRHVIPVTDDDGVAWMVDDDSDPDEASLAAKLRAAQAQSMRFMGKFESRLAREEGRLDTAFSIVDKVAGATEKLAEERLKIADERAALIEAQENPMIEAYGDEVMGILLPKLDAFLDTYIEKNGPKKDEPEAKAEEPKADEVVIEAEVTEKSNQPPGEFFTWVLTHGGVEALEGFTADLESAPTEGPQVRKFWGAVLERVGEVCEAEELEAPASVKRWGADLSIRLTLNLPGWAA